MLQLLYVIALVSWLIFLNIQFRLGDRPVNIGWYALMAGLGTFECAKGFFSLSGNLPATYVAFGAGLFASACILIGHSRRGVAQLEAAAEDEVATAGH